MKILGLLFDKQFSFCDRFDRIIDEAKVRMGKVTRFSGHTWGLETRMLRFTGPSLVISLLRYGYAGTGSGLSDSDLKQTNAHLLNVLARRTVGVGPSARLPILYTMADILVSYHLHIQQRGETLNLILRA